MGQGVDKGLLPGYKKPFRNIMHFRQMMSYFMNNKMILVKIIIKGEKKVLKYIKYICDLTGRIVLAGVYFIGSSVCLAYMKP